MKRHFKQGALALVFSGALFCGAAQAQVMIDMRLITCADFLAMSPADAALSSAWLSGWYNQKIGSTTVDLEAFERNVKNVSKWCASYPKETVMSGLDRATAPKK
ncbi:HdeA/HdeB family chaperone [Methylocella sp.]|uniref:HdeA/HdeB family chaperone n=1 Tax=Methylocella sp. TaxID=1978226 RepID=UPI0035B2EFB6